MPGFSDGFQSGG